MKWLIGLSAAQTVLLAFVGLRVVSLEMRADDIADAADAARLAAQQSAQTRASGAARILPASANAGGPAPDMEEFRAMIREEIAPIITAQTKASAQRDAPVSYHSPEQVKAAQAEFARDLNIARNRAQTSEADISDLYAKIAKLPPHARQAAMTDLAKAVASGEIDARL